MNVFPENVKGNEQVFLKKFQLEAGIGLLCEEVNRINRYCRTVDPSFLERLNRRKPKTMEQLADIWYEGYGEAEISITTIHDTEC